MIVFQTKKYYRKFKFCMVPYDLSGSTIKKMKLILSVNDCALFAFKSLEVAWLTVTASLRPRMMSDRCKVNQCRLERGFK